VFEAGWCEVVRSIVLFLRINTIMGEELKKSGALDEKNDSYPGDGNSVS
jgi:hypothetical protein